MPDLYDSLLKQDIGHLRIIAELWGLELDSKNADAAREKLTVSILDPNLLAELIDSLSPEADSAITSLINTGGRIPWPTFTRKYGDIREAGAGKRDREKLYLKPASTTEILYYRGLLARAFFDTEKGPQEFAYIPDDLFELISHTLALAGSARGDAEPQRENQKESPSPHDSVAENDALGRPASPAEKGKEILANDFILDDATTLLAALRMGQTLESKSLLLDNRPQAVGLQNLLNTAKLLKNNIPQTETVKAFLEASRSDALKMLQEAWLESEAFNELRLMPTIICEGEWKNQPQETREFLLNLLDAIPEGKWWGLNAFIRDVKSKYADFQRPAGDYDSWFIKRASDGQYLRGFEHWDEVDGALVRFFITNILHWLGQVDLSIADGAKEATAFRVSSFEGRKEERHLHRTQVQVGKITVASSGKISILRDAPRVVRYQVSRFCEWEEPKGDVYRYHITTNSLTKAKEQGLKAEQLLSLLAKHSDAGIPPTLVKALKRWEVNGTEARVQTHVILKVSRPEILEEMRRSKAGKFLGEVLSPTTVVVKSGAIQNVMDALTELGLLAEVQTD
ncbi:MAG: helicase-associated domain-containing protein [Anaerolineae bacterium]|nr:helicase-associated domain-containing protein [Anaerolineae bacterium]MCI0607716.1 helicase-associated domain-containing protein [Anaerolineae bacterium]